MDKYKPEILCFNEIKTDYEKLETLKQTFTDIYAHQYWNCCKARKGYSGTAILSRIAPISVTDDFEGHD